MRIHFIGIGGIGMSGIARLYLLLGHSVQGSDLKRSLVTDELEKMGAGIFIGHDASYLDGADLVVYSSSIPEYHPERAEALKRNLRVIHRAEALAELCRGKFTIAVTGTHGKTTTASLVGMILKEASRDPSIAVGGLVKAFGGNACLGKGPEMVIEADESDSSFLKFSPQLEIITNIEAEHMDHFKNMASVEEAYRSFIRRLGSNGAWIGCSEDPRVLAMAKEDPRRAILYGFDEQKSEIIATDIVECPKGERKIAFQVRRNGEKLGRVEMQLIGRHNALNALAAVAAGLKLGISFSVIARALQKYEGAGRRFDVKYEDEKFLIVDDYAHHPTEIRETLAAAKGLEKKRIVAFFQPHRFSRTAQFLEDFGPSFQNADKLIVTDIYAASEAPQPGVSGAILCENIRLQGHPDVTFVSRGEIAEKARGEIKPGDLVILMGAGDIYQVADFLARDLKKTLKENIFNSIRGKVIEHEPLSKHTSLKIGGPAEYWVEPADLEDLENCFRICRAHGKEVFVFGAGSNLLPADEGLKGVVIHLASPYFKEIQLEGENLTARAGAPNTLFIQFALQNGFGGCEFLLGIPGNLGGSVAMNAGSHNQSIDAFLETVTVLTWEGERRVLKKSQIPFRYRFSGIEKAVIVEASFCFPKVSREKTQKKLDEYRDYRLKTQDLAHASAGCMFKNPTIPGCSSGRLIDEAGLKGRRIGKAQVSEKHANFIINLGGATAGDVKELIRLVRETVKEKFQVELETEVKMLETRAIKEKIFPSLSKNGSGFLDRYLKIGGNGEKIAVLAGGESPEREISLISGKAVFEALKAKGFSVIISDTAGDFIGALKKENVTLVFVALHGGAGEDGTIQRILEKEGVAYTGAGPEASERAFDKSQAQEIFKKEGLIVPDFVVLKNSEDMVRVKIPSFPLVVKPARAGSSVGISIISKREDYKKACLEAFRYSQKILVERYIPGRELTVGILGGEALPIVEIIAARKFYDYEAKYKDGGTLYEVPARLTEEEARRVSQAALRAYEALGGEVLSRVDIILGEDGQPYVLEANTIPGLTGKSLLPKAASAAGIDFGGLCVRILTLSLNRLNEKVNRSHDKVHQVEA